MKRSFEEEERGKKKITEKKKRSPEAKTFKQILTNVINAAAF